MSKYIQQLREGVELKHLEMYKAYRKIGAQRSEDDSIKAYLDFRHNVLAEKPAVEDLVGLGSGLFDDYIERARTGKHSFAGSLVGTGMVMVATTEDILHSSYVGDDDKVADQYGNYQHVAFDKLGRGSLLSVLLGEPGACFERLEDVYREHGVIGETDAPHHLGYDFEVFGRAIITGVSGMYPSIETGERMRTTYADILVEDYARGWVEEWTPGQPSGDEFAGFYDLNVANAINRGVAFDKAGYHFDVRSMHERGVNLH